MSNRGADFTDDSSGALGLTHAARAGRIDSGDRVAAFGGGIQKFDLESRAAIDKAQREEFDKKVKALVAKYGWTKKQAEEFARSEAAVPPAERKRASKEEREERARKATETLMGANMKVKGSGSKSRAKRTPGRKWMCPECHLEFCEHRPKRGRPRGDKTARVRTRIAPKTKAILAEHNVSPAAAMEIVASALIAGLPYATALDEWKARRNGAVA